MKQHLYIAMGMALLLSGCTNKTEKPAQATPQTTPKVTSVKVALNDKGPIVVTTSAAEFSILPSGYIQASLLKDGKHFTLDEPSATAPTDGEYIVSNGKEIHFTLDFSQARVSEALGKMGLGKRVEIPGHATGSTGEPMTNTLAFEAYDTFPNLLLTSAAYRNTGNAAVALDKVIAQNHRLDAKLSDADVRPYDMWSFHGASHNWGDDDVTKLKPNFSQANAMGEMIKGGYGGGIPVVAFWTGSVGEAIGHIETLPLSISLPVSVEKDGRVSASMVSEGIKLNPTETYSTARSFVAVYAGDFYEPLRMWSKALATEGWNIPKPSDEAYNVSWCGWGYEFNVTPKQMLGTVPKLKEMGIKWATLDDRWFDTYGDWHPRPDTFPGDSIKQMVDDFHKDGIFAQIWWLPIAVEDGEGHGESHKYIVSKVVKDHPDWLILDKNGKHARMVRDLAALCPALPEVQSYYKQLTEKFIREWGFDGSKLDNVFSVPKCYNPAHHHNSPQDSVNAVAEVYKTIFQTTRAIKPESVTQSCPCGTPPSLAWLPYMDQGVTADPVGAIQVRRRIKMYKALLGPEAAVYGDHVELSEMTPKGDSYSEHGSDFASTIGAGGVVGTKFVWPDPGPKFKPVSLTRSKEEHWKKWIGIYNDKMLSKGTFLDLYTYGYDTPEAYAIEKDGKMYYAFFASMFKGDVELRGLKAGSYTVKDYTDGKDLGEVQSTGDQTPKLPAQFKEHLLIEVAPK
ncbi:MAG TPA: glycoside hydrolase family 36 protein [Terriglobales bacterium]|nr:glycoside hydrolase family 36 protein [Terriglobales bacterium]